MQEGTKKLNAHEPKYFTGKLLHFRVPIMSRGKDFFLYFNSTMAFAIGVLGISRAFLVKLLRLCTIYHSLTCVMFQILVQRGYSWRPLSLCWAAIKDNTSYLSTKKKKGNPTREWDLQKCRHMLSCTLRLRHINLTQYERNQLLECNPTTTVQCVYS